MKKAILISIRPKYVRKILLGEKTLEIRRTCPKIWKWFYTDGKPLREPEPIEVYIYCTKENNALLHKNIADIWWVEDKDFRAKNRRLGIEQQPSYNGKVVAKFTLNKVEKISLPYTKFGKLEWVGCEEERTLQTISLDEKDLLKLSCLTESEIYKYLNFNKKPCGYAWHIDNLEIFDKPKELSEFKIKHYPQFAGMVKNESHYELVPLVKSPQSWCYIEI